MSHTLWSGLSPVRPLLLLLLLLLLSSHRVSLSRYADLVHFPKGILTTCRGPVLVVIDNACRLTSSLSFVHFCSLENKAW